MQTLIIPAAFLFLAAILLWITIGIKGKWWIKLLAMVVTLLVSLEMWRSLDSYVSYFKTADLGSITDKRAILFLGSSRRTGREGERSGSHLYVDATGRGK